MWNMITTINKCTLQQILTHVWNEMPAVFYGSFRNMSRQNLPKYAYFNYHLSYFHINHQWSSFKKHTSFIFLIFPVEFRKLAGSHILFEDKEGNKDQKARNHPLSFFTHNFESIISPLPCFCQILIFFSADFFANEFCQLKAHILR